MFSCCYCAEGNNDGLTVVVPTPPHSSHLYDLKGMSNCTNLQIASLKSVWIYYDTQSGIDFMLTEKPEDILYWLAVCRRGKKGFDTLKVCMFSICCFAPKNGPDNISGASIKSFGKAFLSG